MTLQPKFHRLAAGQPRRGAMAVFAMLLLSLFIVVAAMGIELGMFMADKAEMQRAADAAALAACWEYTAHLAREVNEPDARTMGRQLASTIINDNWVRSDSLIVDLNNDNADDGDIVFGNFNGFGDPYAEITPTDAGVANAVKVTFQKTQSRNGEVLFTLGRLLGLESSPLTVESTASISRKIRGFTSPPDSSRRVNLLPFAVKREMWDSLIAGNGDDNSQVDPDTGVVTPGSDGVLEINIYPHTTGVSGNSGTVDIGSSGNSTNDIKRQISEGVSASDLAYHGGKLELGANGELVLNGDTGISAGMKAELEGIIGDPRVIMVYSQVAGNGNNANFTIIRFVGVRVLYVNFQGSKNSSKKLIIQPSPVLSEYVIVSNGNGGTSENVFAPARIVH